MTSTNKKYLRIEGKPASNLPKEKGKFGKRGGGASMGKVGAKAPPCPPPPLVTPLLILRLFPLKNDYS